MPVRRYLPAAVRLAAGAYPLLIFAACRNGMETGGAAGMALLYFAAALPLVVAALVMASAVAGDRPRLKWTVFVACLMGLAGLVWQLSARLRSHYQWFFLVQDLSFFGLFAYYFGSSLRGGREPLCTYFARLVQPALSAGLIRYTRAVTVAWTALFIVLGAISTLLFFVASSTTWAFFTNLLTPALFAVFFAMEYGCRWLFLPPAERVGFLTTFAAIRKGGYRGGGARVARACPAGGAGEDAPD